MQKGKKILVIGDGHARPDHDNNRFKALGQFILDKQPDIVVNIGDLADMGSLCYYDKGTKHAEGRRYQDDIAAANEALQLYTAPTRQYITKSGRRNTWKPEWHVTLGNHEERINRAATQSPELHGKLSVSDIEFEKYGHKVHEFLVPLIKQGICFQHYLPSGAMGKPTSGVNHARSLIMKGMMSVVVGHSHQRDWYETTKASGEKMFGLVVGCFDQGSHEYAKATEKSWWSGIAILNEAHAGFAEPAFWSMDYLLRKYL